MSIDYYALSIIGIEIPKSDLLSTVKERNCYCELKDLDVKYCPNCGKLAYRNGEQNIKFPELDEEREIDRIGIFSAEYYYYIGYIHKIDRSASSWNMFSDFNEINMGDLQLRIDTLLKSHEINDSYDFGLYTLLIAW